MNKQMTIRLNNGVETPMAGIGTFLLAPDEAEASCLSALECGYRLIDTANACVNERAVGRAMKKSGKSNARIILRWHIQAGNIVIPGSRNPSHIKDNFALFDFALTAEEMAEISALDRNAHYYTSAPELLKRCAETVPPVDGQK